MTLKELANEYRQSAELLKRRENYIKEKIKKGELKDNMDTQIRIRYLRDERYDAIKTADYLENYYSFKEAKCDE